MIKIKINDKHHLNEGLDLKSVKKFFLNLKEYLPNISFGILKNNFDQIKNAIAEFYKLDNSQSISNLVEARKPIIYPLINKYGLLVSGIAIAFIMLSGKPPEIPSNTVLDMINMGLKNRTVEDFFSSLNSKNAAELAADVFTGGLGGGMMENKSYIYKSKLKQIINESLQEHYVFENELGNDSASLEDGTPVCEACLYETMTCGCPDVLEEAKYQGRSVPLGKPMRGDVKKFKVYVRDPSTGNIKKVNFGDPNMKIKKSNPKRRKSFRARHNCDNPGPRTKARYWSCRKW